MAVSARFSIPASHSLPGQDDITRRQLDNGIILLSRPNPYNPTVIIGGHLPAGSIFDPESQLGLADFTAACLMHGSLQHSHQQIYDALESVGASLGFSCGVHTVGFHGQALQEDLPLLLELLAECLRYPSFPLDEVERLRAQMLTSLAIRAQDTGDMASLTFDQLVYANHPYSRPEDGYPETIQAISQSDLAAFHQKHFGPRGLVMAIVGPLDPLAAVDMLNHVLGDWQNPDQPPSPVLPALAPLNQIPQRKVTLPGKTQTDLCLGIAGPPRLSPDFLPAALGNDVLGQFAMMGRIGQAVREQAGLAYYAYSSLGSGIGPGPWVVSAGVDPANLDQAIQLILQEIQRFITQPIDADELADSQACFIGRLPISLESNQGVAAALLNLERYGLDLDYYRQYPDLVHSVTVQDVLETARRYWNPNRLAIASAGP